MQGLYFLQRGPLLRPCPAAKDRQAMYQAIALNAAPPAATGPFFVPQVWALSADGDGAALVRPPVTLSLCEAAAVVDVGMEVFVWVGAAMESFGGEAPLLERCMEVVRVCLVDRHPQPLVRRVRGEEVLAELLGCLDPLQNDRVGWQRARWLRVVHHGVVPTLDESLVAASGGGQSMHGWAESHKVVLT